MAASLFCSCTCLSCLSSSKGICCCRCLLHLSLPLAFVVAFALAFLACHPPKGDLLLHSSTTSPSVNLLQMPPREYHFWVYILSSRSRNLYIGITNDIHRRVALHREARPATHTAHYNIYRLVYCEYFRYVRTAIAREKELKRWTRAQKIELIERINPTWEDILPPTPL